MFFWPRPAAPDVPVGGECYREPNLGGAMIFHLSPPANSAAGPDKTISKKGKPGVSFLIRAAGPGDNGSLWAGSGGGGGWDESVRRGAGSQRIVAAGPLCRLQCPVAYLSRLQRILPAARVELSFKAAARGSSAAGARPTARARGGRGPYCGSGGRRAEAPHASLDSDLEAFSHNPAHGSFAPLAFQPSAMTNCVNQRFLSY